MGVKQRAPNPAAAILLHRGGKVWLGQRGQTRFLPGFSVFPGGTCETDESTRQAARRELAEETGIELPDSCPLIPFSRAVTPAYSRYRYDVKVYLARLPESLEPKPDGVEITSGRWYTAEQALQARADGEIQLAPPTYRQLVLWKECQEQPDKWPAESEAFAAPRGQCQPPPLLHIGPLSLPLRSLSYFRTLSPVAFPLVRHSCAVSCVCLSNEGAGGRAFEPNAPRPICATRTISSETGKR